MFYVPSFFVLFTTKRRVLAHITRGRRGGKNNNPKKASESFARSFNVERVSTASASEAPILKPTIRLGIEWTVAEINGTTFVLFVSFLLFRHCWSQKNVLLINKSDCPFRSKVIIWQTFVPPGCSCTRRWTSWMGPDQRNVATPLVHDCLFNNF